MAFRTDHEDLKSHAANLGDMRKDTAAMRLKISYKH
jgi:hypothetical protein